MAKKSTCDECGEEIRYGDMEDGTFREIVNYHPAAMHVTTIEIEFQRDVTMITPAPDLCKKCMIKHLLKALKAK